MSRVAKALVAAAFAIALLLPAAFAQQEQDTTAPKKITKEQKKKMSRAFKELDDQYKEWLNEDVVYIITPEERRTFLQLSTNEEREQFIEQFWLRRSSNPDLPDNDFKEEHYRRIAYANEHYASGIPGWKTDRGRTYIIWALQTKSIRILRAARTTARWTKAAAQQPHILGKPGATVISKGSVRT